MVVHSQHGGPGFDFMLTAFCVEFAREQFLLVLRFPEDIYVIVIQGYELSGMCIPASLTETVARMIKAPRNFYQHHGQS